jgi:hypothetical protein
VEWLTNNLPTSPPCKSCKQWVEFLNGATHAMNANTLPAYLKLSDFANRVPGHKANARLHISTLIRWCTRGVKLPDGSRLRLRADRVGSRWLTTNEWFAEFLSAMTTAHNPTSAGISPVFRSPHQRQQSSQKADEEAEQESVSAQLNRHRTNQLELSPKSQRAGGLASIPGSSPKPKPTVAVAQSGLGHDSITDTL